TRDLRSSSIAEIGCAAWTGEACLAPTNPLGSIPLETRLGLAYESFIGALVVVGLHADGLRLRFRLNGLVNPHAPFLMNAALGHGVSECRPFRQLFRHGLRFA